MAIRLAEQYLGKAAPPSEDYPHGAPRNESLPDANDGTPFEEAWLRDYEGFFQALLKEADITPSGEPDTALVSQRLEALKTLLLPRAEIGPEPEQVPTNSMFGSAARKTVGPDPDQIPTNDMLGGAAGLPNPVIPGTFLQAKSDGSGYDALTLSQMYDLLGWQVGDYKTGSDDPNDPPPPSAHWVRCAAGLTGPGQYNEGKLRSESVSGGAPLISATAIVDDPESPMYGRTIHLVETERLFLRPGSLGTLQDDQNRSHTHAVHIQQATDNRWPRSVTAVQGWEDTKPALTTSDEPVIPAGGDEARPRNIGVAVYRRIK